MRYGLVDQDRIRNPETVLRGELTVASNSANPGRFFDIAFFLSVLTLYVLTTAPTAIWGDSALFSMQAMDWTLRFGAADHPLFILLSGIAMAAAGFSPMAPNLMAGLTGAAAAFFSYRLSKRMTGSTLAGIAAGSSLAVSHAYWLHSCIAEVYVLNAFFVLAAADQLSRWVETQDDRRGVGRGNANLVVASFLLGLGLFNHLILALLVPPLFVLLWVTDSEFRKVRTITLAAISYLAGSLPLVILLIHSLITRGLKTTFGLASAGGGFPLGLPNLRTMKEAGLYLAYLVYQYPGLGVLLGLAGIFLLPRKHNKTARILAVLWLTNAVFFLLYKWGGPVSTRYTFYISDYAIFSVFVGIGMARFIQRYRSGAAKLLLSLVPAVTAVAIYACMPSLLDRSGLSLIHARTLPYRDNNRFFLFPPKTGYRGPERFAREVFDSLPSGAVVIADYTPYTVLLLYRRLWNERADIDLLASQRGFAGEIMLDIEEVCDEEIPRRRVYLVDLESEHYYVLPDPKRYRVEKRGIVYELVPFKESVSP